MVFELSTSTDAPLETLEAAKEAREELADEEVVMELVGGSITETELS